MASSQNDNNNKIAHPAEAGVTIYYWSCSLVLLAPSLLVLLPLPFIAAAVAVGVLKVLSPVVVVMLVLLLRSVVHGYTVAASPPGH